MKNKEWKVSDEMAEDEFETEFGLDDFDAEVDTHLEDTIVEELEAKLEDIIAKATQARPAPAPIISSAVNSSPKSRAAMGELDLFFHQLNEEKERLELQVKELSLKKQELVRGQKIEIERFLQDKRSELAREIRQAKKEQGQAEQNFQRACDEQKESMRLEFQNQKQAWLEQQELEKKQWRKEVAQEENSLRERALNESKELKTEAKLWAQELVESAKSTNLQIKNQIEAERTQHHVRLKEEKDLVVHQLMGIEERYQENIKLLKTEYAYLHEIIKEKKDLASSSVEIYQSRQKELREVEQRFESIRHEKEQLEREHEAIKQELRSLREKTAEMEGKLQSQYSDWEVQKGHYQEFLQDIQRIQLEHEQAAAGTAQANHDYAETQNMLEVLNGEKEELAAKISKYRDGLRREKQLLKQEQEELAKVQKIREQEIAKLDTAKELFEKYKKETSDLLDEKNRLNTICNDLTRERQNLEEQRVSAQYEIQQSLAIKQEIHQQKLQLEEERNGNILVLNAKKKEFERELLLKRDSILKVKDDAEKEVVQLKIEQERLLASKHAAIQESEKIKNSATQYAEAVQAEAQAKAKQIHQLALEQMEQTEKRRDEEWLSARRKQINYLQTTLVELVKKRLSEISPNRKMSDEMRELLKDFPQITLKIIEGGEIDVKLLPDLKSKLKTKKFWKRVTKLAFLALVFGTILVLTPIEKWVKQAQNYFQQQQNKSNEKMQQMEDERIKARRYVPEETKDYKSSYWENALHTENYLSLRADEKRKQSWILGLQRILVDDNKMTENNFIAFVALEAQLVRELGRIKNDLSTFNSQREIEKMKALEAKFRQEAKALFFQPENFQSASKKIKNLEEKMFFSND